MNIRFLLSLLAVSYSSPSPTSASIISLQWALCDKDPAAVLAKLGYHPHRHPRKVANITYYDLNPPRYTASGLAFRTKEHKHHPISVVKRRYPNETHDVPKDADCVWGRYGNASWFQCGLSTSLEGNQTTLWSEQQLAFAEEHQVVEWGALVPYGPFVNKKWKIRVAGHKVVFDDVEAVVKGKVLHLMEVELNFEGDRHRGDRLYEKLSLYLTRRHVRLCGPVQLPKTLRLFDALKQAKSLAEL